MKRFWLGLILAVVVSSPALALNECYSGSWIDLARGSEGIDLQVGENTIVLYRYAYVSGPWHMFWVGVGPNEPNENGEYVLEAFQTLGGTDSSEGKVGTFVLVPAADDPNLLGFEYNFQLDLSRFLREDGIAIPWCIGCADAQELVPLFKPKACE